MLHPGYEKFHDLPRTEAQVVLWLGVVDVLQQF
jgi:hypothetical protein